MGVKHKRKLSENENVDDAPRKVLKQQQAPSENVVEKTTAENYTAIASSNKESDSEPKQQPQQQKVNYHKRKKHFYNSIRDQMEFYFGDANLTKDRFLRQLIDKDPMVPLEVFLTFNKMKQITTNVQDIAKALKNSELLELDDTQLKVKRKTPIPVERNVDEQTLYVESLPPTVDHEWLRHIFSRFGKIAYISLPKYTKSKKIKGFAFIEFESEKSVEKAVQTFKKFNSVLCMIEQDPSELCSIKTYIKEKEGQEVTETKPSDEKKQLENASEDSFGQSKSESTANSSEKQQQIADAACTDSNSQNDSHTEDGAGANEMSTHKQQQKKKKRRKKRKSSAEKWKNAVELNSAIIYNELKILPKIHWKRLRNKYLNMQRQCIKELKAKAYKERQEVKHQQQQQQPIARHINNGSSSMQTTKHIVTQTLDNHSLQTISMNFYGAGDDNPQAKLEISKNAVENSAPTTCITSPKYEPGLIMEIALLEPCDAKEFKAEMRQHAAIKYIDAKDGQMTVFIRMESPKAANDLIHKISCAEYQCKILSGDAEKEYWYKIERDRAEKLSKQVKIPQKRSRKKIQNLINKHIRFDDEKDEME